MSQRQHLDKTSFDEVCAEHMLNVIIKSLEKDNYAMIGLSGGSTPIPIYKLLSKKMKEKLTLNKNIIFFLMDDRYVLNTHKDSNQKLVLDSFGQDLIEKITFLAPKNDLPIDQCVKDYENQLKESLNKMPKRKVHLGTLGMGPDGHTCSLFPATGVEALDKMGAFDKTLKVLHTTTNQFAVFDRITVNFYFLHEMCEELFMFIKGNDKIELWNKLVDYLDKESSSEEINKELLTKYPCLCVAKMKNTICFESE
ncbi:hypothetical protein ABK040_008330 [Willaertia magna]